MGVGHPLPTSKLGRLAGPPRVLSVSRTVLRRTLKIGRRLRRNQSGQREPYGSLAIVGFTFKNTSKALTIYPL